MLELDLLTADEAAKSLRISRRTFDGRVARGEIAYIAVGLGLKRVCKRFDPKDIAQFRYRQRRVECPPEPTRKRKPAAQLPEHRIIDFRALSEERRAARRAERQAKRDGRL